VRQGVLGKERVSLSLVVGKELAVPDFKKHMKLMHTGVEWGSVTDGKDGKWHSDYPFDGKAVSNFMKQCLKREDIKKVYFPLAFNGKVAMAISDQGFEVLASDLKEYWVSHLKTIGLRAQRRSFEQMPHEKFDIAVSYEPFPIIQDPEGYLGVLKLLSRKIPFVYIRGMAPTPSLDDGGMRALNSSEPIRLESSPSGNARHISRLSCDYGASFIQARAYTDFKGSDEKGNRYGTYIINAIVPTAQSAKNAKLDLRLLSMLDQWKKESEISIGHLAESLSLPLEQVAASLYRIYDVLALRFRGYWHPATPVKIIE